MIEKVEAGEARPKILVDKINEIADWINAYELQQEGEDDEHVRVDRSN